MVVPYTVELTVNLIRLIASLSSPENKIVQEKLVGFMKLQLYRVSPNALVIEDC